MSVVYYILSTTVAFCSQSGTPYMHRGLSDQTVYQNMLKNQCLGSFDNIILAAKESKKSTRLRSSLLAGQLSASINFGAWERVNDELLS